MKKLIILLIFDFINFELSAQNQRKYLHENYLETKKISGNNNMLLFTSIFSNILGYGNERGGGEFIGLINNCPPHRIDSHPHLVSIYFSNKFRMFFFSFT